MKLRLSRTQVPLLATTAVFALFYSGASIRYDGFFSWTVFVNLLHDNAFLGLAAIGMTFVILAGGIDLSVGALVGFTSTFIARLIAHQLHPLPAILIALVIGTGFGAGMGALIRFAALPPFLVTLAGMFFMRGLGFAVSLETIPIKHPFYEAISEQFGRSSIGTGVWGALTGGLDRQAIGAVSAPIHLFRRGEPLALMPWSFVN